MEAARMSFVSPTPYPEGVLGTGIGRSYAAGTYFSAAPGAQIPSTSTSQPGIPNHAWAGVLILITTTTINGATLVVSLQNYDPIGGKAGAGAGWYDVPAATTGNITTNTTTSLLILPGTVETANVRISQIITPLFRIKAVVTVATITAMTVSAYMLSY